MVDPDPHNVSTKCKEHQTASEDNISAAVNAPQPNYPFRWLVWRYKANAFFHVCPFFHCQCHHSFRKNDTPHNLKVALCIFRGQECLWPGQFLQTYFGSFVKIMQVSLYESKSVTDLENEDNMQPKWICTSTLKQWHRYGRGDCINPQPVMEVLVTKTSLELDKQSSSRDSGVKCLLYEARNSLNGQQPAANYWNS